MSFVPRASTTTFSGPRQSTYTLGVTAANTYSREVTGFALDLTSSGTSGFVNVTSNPLPMGLALTTAAPWTLQGVLPANTSVPLELTFTVGGVGSFQIQAATSALFNSTPALIRNGAYTSPLLTVVSPPVTAGSEIVHERGIPCDPVRVHYC